MRSAAKMPAEPEPVPERSGLEAKAGRVLDERLSVIGEIRDALRFLPAAAADPHVRDQLAARLQQVTVALFDSGLHDEELRGELARYTAVNALTEHAFAAGVQHERERAAKAAVPGPRRHAAGRHVMKGQLALVADKARGVALPAFVAGWAALRGLAKVSRGHGTAVKLTAYHLKLAAVVTASTATLAIGGVVITRYTGTSPSGPYGSGTGPAPAASAYAAIPVTSESPIALLATRPKPKAGKGKSLLSASSLPVPYLPVTEPSSSSSSPASSSPPASSAPGVPAALAQLPSALDLSSGAPETITLTATGNQGWVSWRVDATGPDLDFSKMSGVLAPGQSYQLAVSVDPAQAQDGNPSETFTIDGQSVTVNLPPPPPAPSPADTTTDTPPPVPSTPPSPSDPPS